MWYKHQEEPLICAQAFGKGGMHLHVIEIPQGEGGVVGTPWGFWHRKPMMSELLSLLAVPYIPLDIYQVLCRNLISEFLSKNYSLVTGKHDSLCVIMSYGYPSYPIPGGASRYRWEEFGFSAQVLLCDAKSY